MDKRGRFLKLEWNASVGAMSGLEWSGRVDLNHQPPRPEKCNQKIQVLHLVSLIIGARKPFFLSLSCTEVVPNF